MLLDPDRLVPAIKAQLDSGRSIARLEEELRFSRQRMEMLEQAEQKALRLHLYLPNHPPEKLESEIRRIAEQRQQLAGERARMEKQLAGLKQAIVDKEGLRRFCETASRNLESLHDGQWRLLLEAMRLEVHVNDGAAIIARVAVPTVRDEKGAIVLCTSPSPARPEALGITLP